MGRGGGRDEREEEGGWNTCISAADYTAAGGCRRLVLRWRKGCSRESRRTDDQAPGILHYAGSGANCSSDDQGATCFSHRRKHLAHQQSWGYARLASRQGGAHRVCKP